MIKYLYKKGLTPKQISEIMANTLEYRVFKTQWSQNEQMNINVREAELKMIPAAEDLQLQPLEKKIPI